MTEASFLGHLWFCEEMPTYSKDVINADNKENENSNWQSEEPVN